MNTTTARDFGDLLRTYRIRRGTTQQQLADLSAVSVRTVRNLELGRVLRPRPETAERIADALGLSGAPRDDFQASAARVGRARTLPLGHPTARMVPTVPQNEIVGRHAELSTLRKLVITGGRRMITVTGIGGVGKSRLALDVIRGLPDPEETSLLWSSDRYRADPPESDWLARVVKDAVSGPMSSVDELVALVANRPTVLVLDGYDIGAVRADRIRTLLHSCDRLRLLVTARAPSGIDDETVFSLGPLAVPEAGRDHDLAALNASPTVRLLVSCVHLFRPSFAVTSANAGAVAALCRFTDGIPAGLERMASWLTVQDPDELLGCIRSDPVGFVSDLLPELWESLDRTVTELTPAEETVLEVLAEKASDLSVGEAADVSGVAPLACARATQRLVVLGLVRPIVHADRTRLEVLGWVRALLSRRSLQLGHQRVPLRGPGGRHETPATRPRLEAC